MNHASKIANKDIIFRNNIDGLWDLAIGLALLLVGFSFLFDAVAIAGALCFSIYLLILGIKQKVVYPRIGYVKHKGVDIKTKKIMTITLIIGVFMFIVAFFLYLQVATGQNSTAMQNIASNYGGIILGLVFSFVIVLLAKSFSINRFYWYAPLILLSFLAIQLINFEGIIPISFLSCGGIITTVGIVTFVKFINTYPRLEDKADE